MTEITHRSYGLEVKKLESDGSFSGYGSVFGVVDGHNEVVEYGAFKKSLSAHKKAGTMPALLWQHDQSEPIGVFSLMREDETGLYVEGKLLIGQNVPNADKAYSLLKAGALSGLSIGFATKKHEWDNQTGVRRLKEVELWETSLVTFPANGAARVTAVKSLEGLKMEEIPNRKRDIEAVLRDAGCSITVAKAIASQAGTLVACDEQKGLVEVLKKATNILKD